MYTAIKSSLRCEGVWGLKSLALQVKVFPDLEMKKDVGFRFWCFKFGGQGSWLRGHWCICGHFNFHEDSY